MPELPLVSILVPCYNEQATISLLLEAVWQQTFPAEQLEVIIADGMSTDGTRQAIGDFAGTHPQLTIQVVDNPQRIIPAGLNLAIEAARGTVLLRLDHLRLHYIDSYQISLREKSDLTFLLLWTFL